MTRKLVDENRRFEAADHALGGATRPPSPLRRQWLVPPLICDVGRPQRPLVAEGVNFRGRVRPAAGVEQIVALAATAGPQQSGEARRDARSARTQPGHAPPCALRPADAARPPPRPRALGGAASASGARALPKTSPPRVPEGDPGQIRSCAKAAPRSCHNCSKLLRRPRFPPTYTPNAGAITTTCDHTRPTLANSCPFQVIFDQFWQTLSKCDQPLLASANLRHSWPILAT